MNCINDDHPTDEKLTEYALNNSDEYIKIHILSCPSCSRHIKEIRSVKTILQTIPDEEVPEKLQKVLKKTTNSTYSITSWFEFTLINWYKNPLIIGLGIIGAVVFFFLFFVFIL